MARVQPKLPHYVARAKRSHGIARHQRRGSNGDGGPGERRGFFPGQATGTVGAPFFFTGRPVPAAIHLIWSIQYY